MVGQEKRLRKKVSSREVTLTSFGGGGGVFPLHGALYTDVRQLMHLYLYMSFLSQSHTHTPFSLSISPFCVLSSIVSVARVLDHRDVHDIRHCFMIAVLVYIDLLSQFWEGFRWR